MPEPVGYTGNPEGEAHARDTGAATGRGACIYAGAAAAAELCAAIGAELGGGLYRAFHTDPSLGTLVPLEMQAQARDRARRAELARALDQVLLTIEAAGFDRGQTVAELRSRGVDIVETLPEETAGGWIMGGPSTSPPGIYMTPIPYAIAPPSYQRRNPYNPNAGHYGGIANEGDVELRQWAEKLEDHARVLAALLAEVRGEPIIIRRGPILTAPEPASSGGSAAPVVVAAGGLLALLLALGRR
jgi:hypothetical protein